MKRALVLLAGSCLLALLGWACFDAWQNRPPEPEPHPPLEEQAAALLAGRDDIPEGELWLSAPVPIYTCSYHYHISQWWALGEPHEYDLLFCGDTVFAALDVSGDFVNGMTPKKDEFCAALSSCCQQGTEVTLVNASGIVCLVCGDTVEPLDDAKLGASARQALDAAVEEIRAAAAEGLLQSGVVKKQARIVLP